MKISVVISTYNGSDYIEEQLNSILRQIRKPDEVIICDDSSSDNTVDIINSFILSNHLINWKLVVNKGNKGWRKNFMDLIWMAGGDIIFPCDQDDIWEENKLFEMEKIMIKYPKILLLVSGYRAFFVNGKSYEGPEKLDEKISKKRLGFDFFNTKYPGCTYCIRRNLIEKSKGYWQIDFPHDAFFWRLATIQGSAYSLNKPLVNWRKHSESAYSIESIDSKSVENKLMWLDYADRVLNSVEAFVKNENCCFQDNIELIIEKNKNWVRLRRRLFAQKNILVWIKLLKYRKCYTRIKQYFGDLYLVIKDKR